VVLGSPGAFGRVADLDPSLMADLLLELHTSGISIIGEPLGAGRTGLVVSTTTGSVIKFTTGIEETRLATWLLARPLTSLPYVIGTWGVQRTDAAAPFARYFVFAILREALGSPDVDNRIAVDLAANGLANEIVIGKMSHRDRELARQLRRFTLPPPLRVVDRHVANFGLRGPELVLRDTGSARFRSNVAVPAFDSWLANNASSKLIAARNG